MASYVKKNITCMCCGKKYEANMLKGYSVDDDANTDLDTNPHSPALYDRVLLCPYCGYATAEPYTAISDELKALICEDNYKAVLNNKAYDDVCRKLLLAGYLSVKRRNAKEAGYNYLLAYWYMKEKGILEFEKAREKAIKNFERYLGKNMDLEVAMILVDLLRQNSNFDEAKETVTSLKTFIDGNVDLEKIAVFEEKLIANNDSNIHRIGEVSV